MIIETIGLSIHCLWSSIAVTPIDAMNCPHSYKNIVIQRLVSREIFPVMSLNNWLTFLWNQVYIFGTDRTIVGLKNCLLVTSDELKPAYPNFI